MANFLLSNMILFLSMASLTALAVAVATRRKKEDA
jgi:hypothetical protein